MTWCGFCTQKRWHRILFLLSACSQRRPSRRRTRSLRYRDQLETILFGYWEYLRTRYTLSIRAFRRITGLGIAFRRRSISLENTTSRPDIWLLSGQWSRARTWHYLL